MMTRIAIPVAVHLFALPALLFLSCKGGKEGDTGQTAAPARSYRVATVYAGPGTVYYTFPAVIQGEQNVEIRPKVDGFVQDIYVDEGAVVKKGQPLFRLNNPQYEEALRSAAAQVKIAKADVNAARMNVDKVRPLVEKDIISKYELQSNEYTLEAKEAALASAQANLTNAQVNAGYTYLTSPASGIIGTLPYKVGSLVSSSSASPLTTVYNTNNIYAYFSLNEKQLLEFYRAVKGNTLQDKLATLPDVSLILADGSEYPRKGRVVTASGLITTETGSASFRANFPNPNALIRSGSSANVKIPIHYDSLLAIPQMATYNLQGKKFVYVINDKDSLQNVAVTVSGNTIGNLFIIQEGLKKGDRVVLDGVTNLKPGMVIKPLLVNADSLYKEVNGGR